MSEPRTVRVGTCTPINPAEIPVTVGMILAQTLLPDLQRAYADPIIQADYQRWKAERAAKSANKKSRGKLEKKRKKSANKKSRGNKPKKRKRRD